MDKSWRVILAFVGIFIAGTVTGGLISLRIFHAVSERAGPDQAQRPANPPPQINPQVFKRLTEQLGLTADQREKLKPIEVRATEELRRLSRDTRHNTELIIERTQDEISAVLDPQQRTKFEELVARRREVIKKFIQDQELQQLRNRRDPEKPNRLRENAPPK